MSRAAGQASRGSDRGLRAAAAAGRSEVLRVIRTLRAAAELVWQTSRGRLLLVVVLQVAAGMLLAAQVLLGKQALEAVLAADAGRADLGDAVLPLVLLALAGAAASFSAPLLNEQQRFLGELVQRQTASRIVDATSVASLSAFDTDSFHDRLQRVQASAALRPLIVTQALVALAGGLAAVAALLVTLAAIELLLLPLLVMAGGPLLWISRRSSAIEFDFAVSQAPGFRLREYLTEVLVQRRYVKDVRAYDAAGFLRGRFDRSWDTYLVDLRGLVRRRLRFALLGSTVLAAVTALTFLVLLALVVDDRIALAEAGAAAIAVRLLASRMEVSLVAVSRLLESAYFIDDLQAFLAAAPEPEQGGGGSPLPVPFERLDATDLRFTYPNGRKEVLRGVDLTLRPGEVVALVGDNGCGKSTLLKLLAGLYTAQVGSLTRNGVDITEMGPATWRTGLVAVFQDFARLGLPAADNIAMGRHDEPAAVAASAAAADADAFLAALPDGYATPLGAEFAGGTDLSGGQWQRVALARALHRQVDVYLLDEPSAALDPAAELRMLARIRAALADRSVLVVSHRSATVRAADRILVMSAGRIVEQGTHDQLMATGGTYAAMWAGRDFG